LTVILSPASKAKEAVSVVPPGMLIVVMLCLLELFVAAGSPPPTGRPDSTGDNVEGREDNP
jgi:hypothetical protein